MIYKGFVIKTAPYGKWTVWVIIETKVVFTVAAQIMKYPVDTRVENPVTSALDAIDQYIANGSKRDE